MFELNLEERTINISMKINEIKHSIIEFHNEINELFTIEEAESSLWLIIIKMSDLDYDTTFNITYNVVLNKWKCTRIMHYTGCLGFKYSIIKLTTYGKTAEKALKTNNKIYSKLIKELKG
mgnify:CR=1 FL=1